MEKLKAKHDHKLTDILKVAIFGLMLILPGLILLPSMLYYSVNEYATAPTEQVEKIEYERVNFNQLAQDNEYLTNYYFNFEQPQDNQYANLIPNINNVLNHKLYCRLENLQHGQGTYYFYFSLTNTTIHTSSFIETIDINNTNLALVYGTSVNGYLNVYDLTQMFGAGNEPTMEQFNEWYPNDYYEYTQSRYEILEIPTGTYETYTDITSQIQFNWNSLWQQPLFSWTNYTILKQGLDNFTYVFGITQTSYINNLITYELIMVAIYIVIDIVLTLFKWLTHLIGEK